MGTINGTSGKDNPLYGTSGNDSIYGFAGNDRIITGNGDDYVDAGDGDDEVNGYPSTGGQYSYWSPSGKKTIYGGTGNDFLIGGIENDVISGDSDNDQIFGHEGDDKLLGGEGNDIILGGLGNDILDGGVGVDELYGEEGNDTYYVRDKYDYIYDTSGIDTAYVSANFVKIPSSIEKVYYTEGALPLPYWIDGLIYDRASGNTFDKLLGATNTFSYAFPSQLQAYFSANSAESLSFTPFTSQQISRAETALLYISTLIDVRFSRIFNSSNLNTISFASNSQVNSAAYSYSPNSTFAGSDIFLSLSSDNSYLYDGSYGALTLIHEIGHALGLKHAGTSDGASGTPPYLTGVDDTTEWTVMSYNSNPKQYNLMYSELDIAALQFLYGPNKNTRSSNDFYKISIYSPNFVWDGAGTDTIDLSEVNLGSTAYLTPGYWGFVGTAKKTTITSTGQITVNFGTVIENLIGSNYSDKLFGNEVDNNIKGSNGNDLIEGWDGNDTLVGGLGDDQLNGGAGIDAAEFSGNFTSYSIVKYTTSFSVTDKRYGLDGVDSLVSVERLKFLDKAIAIDLDGNAGITAKVIGAVLGKDFLKIPAYVGIGLSYTDKGMSYSELGALALSAVGATTNDAIVSTLWRNVLGFNPTTADKAPLIKMLDDGMKPGDLVVLAADTSFNTTNIGLVGLVQTGIEYLPDLNLPNA